MLWVSFYFGLAPGVWRLLLRRFRALRNTVKRLCLGIHISGFVIRKHWASNPGIKGQKTMGEIARLLTLAAKFPHWHRSFAILQPLLELTNYPIVWTLLGAT